MLTGLGFAAAAFIYFLPSWLGAEKQNRTAIFLLNLLLGWSIIGWVVALVWATTKDPATQQSAAVTQPFATPAAPLALPIDPDVRASRLKDLRDRGVITQDEFLALIAQ